MSFSVVVSFLDRSSFFTRLLESVQKQTAQVNELLIIDNGSKLSEIDSVVKKIRNSNLTNIEEVTVVSTVRKFNANTARNLGLELSKQKYVAFLDSDDWWEPDHLENALNLLEATGKAACYCGANVISSNSVNRRIISRDVNKFSNPLEFLSSVGSIAQTSSYVVERNKILDAVTWDENLLRHQDYDFFLSVFVSTEGWAFGKNITTNIDWNDWSIKNKKIDFKSIGYFYEKWERYAKESYSSKLKIYKLIVNAVSYDVISKEDRMYLEQVLIDLSLNRRTFKKTFRNILSAAVSISSVLLLMRRSIKSFLSDHSKY
ncbi:glycosyltransferase family 2 protein [Idiomarina sp. HB]|uniref:glycosyltransferase family 2 protein n=1 Tax=Idiomarina sp. HB TaxID=3110479 RepID=UPI003A80EE4B